MNVVLLLSNRACRIQNKFKKNTKSVHVLLTPSHLCLALSSPTNTLTCATFPIQILLLLLLLLHLTTQVISSETYKA